MSVARDQHQIVLQCERRDPEIVVRHRRSGALELHKQARVMLRRFPRRKQNSDRGPSQEILQKNLVAVLLGAAKKSRFDLCQDHQGQPDLIAFAQPVSQPGVTLKQIGEPVGVQDDSYFHLSQSIWRWEAITSSKAGSGVHWPTSSEKSDFRTRPMVARVSSSTTS